MFWYSLVAITALKVQSLSAGFQKFEAQALGPSKLCIGLRLGLAFEGQLRALSPSPHITSDAMGMAYLRLPTSIGGCCVMHRYLTTMYIAVARYIIYNSF